MSFFTFHIEGCKEVVFYISSKIYQRVKQFIHVHFEKKKYYPLRVKGLSITNRQTNIQTILCLIYDISSLFPISTCICCGTILLGQQAVGSGQLMSMKWSV